MLKSVSYTHLDVYKRQAKLNAITHPVILARLKKEIAAYKDAKVIVLDAPTLFEAGADRLCRRVVSVLADETVRLGRICRRDGLTEQEALTRMHAQQSDDFYIDRSDYTLDNTVAVSADNMDNMLAVLGCAPVSYTHLVQRRRRAHQKGPCLCLRAHA